MRSTVKAKLLLGWMSQREAVDALNACVFDPPLTRKRAIALWKEYRQKVEALPPRRPEPFKSLTLTDQERPAVEKHIEEVRRGAMGRFLGPVLKVNPEDLIARQFFVITERADEYAQAMRDEQTRINHFLGIGLQFKGVLPPPRIVSHAQLAVDLPHAEFVPLAIPGGITFKERDRYVTAAFTPDGRMSLWAGYHRTYALLVLRQAAGEAAGAAPLLTVMTGMGDVQTFFLRPSAVRETVLGDRPALLRDFLDSDLFIEVNLRKKRAEGRIEQYRPNKMRARVILVDES